MKNRLTLVIASVLLILCVFEKEARYKTISAANVEKMYNIPQNGVKNSLELYPAGDVLANEGNSLYNPAKFLKLTSGDTTLNQTEAFEFSDENPLNISVREHRLSILD